MPASLSEQSLPQELVQALRRSNSSATLSAAATAAESPTGSTESGSPESGKALAARQLAELLPAETPLALFFSTDLNDWEALQQFELFAKFTDFINDSGAGIADSETGLPALLSAAANTERWQGDQFVVATLPDTSPRSIAVNDLDKEVFMVAPVVNESALAAYKETLAVSRDEAPEKSTYLGAELWVWPTQEVSFGDYGNWNDNEQNLPAVPHEEWPNEDSSKNQNSKSQNSKSQNSKKQDQAGGFNKALNLERSVELPVPEDFEPEENYDTYTVEGKAIAFLDGFLIQASEPETLKKLLDYQEFNYARLSNNPLFSRSQYGQEAGAIARVYSDLSEISKYNLNGREFAGTAFPFPGIPDIPGVPGVPDGLLNVPPSPILRQELQAQIASALKGITMEGIIYPQAEGIRVQGRIYGNNLLRSNPTPELDYADSALEFVPAATYSLSSGRDIAGIWRQLTRSLSLNETAYGYLEQGRNFIKAATGLDLDTELIGWMDREFVLFFFPSREGALNSFSPGLGVEIGVAIQTSDRPTAQKTMDTIDSLLSFFAQPTTVNGTPVMSWQAPSFGPNPDGPTFTSYISHSWISEDTLILTSGTGAMAQLLNPTAFNPVSEHPTFLNATDTLAKPNNGYGYFNAGSSLSLIYSLISQWLEVPADDPFFQTVKSYLGTIRGAGSTTSSTREYWQLDSLLNLAPAEEKPPAATDTSEVD
ncbi:MAG: DUF3352 domain-containing protein [Cyanobacteria bacterium P01_D01_bin.105]